MKIIFAENKNKRVFGTCRREDRNYHGEIIIYKNCENVEKTLIHELIHSFLFERIRNGDINSRILNNLNNSEKFVDGLAIKIAEGLKIASPEIKNIVKSVEVS